MLGLSNLTVAVVGIMVGTYMLAKCSELLDNKTVTWSTHLLAGVAAVVSLFGIIALVLLGLGGI